MLVGLTGGIGSGKSTVAGLLREAGLVVIDADSIAREVVEPGMPALAAIVDRFGPQVQDGDLLDRAALARIVFADADARADLEAITHPAIAAEVDRRHREAVDADPAAIVVLDHPLLVETGRSAGMDATIVVLAARSTRRDRLVDARGMAPDDVDARMAAQASDDERRSAATWLVDNDGSPDDLARQVRDLVEAVVARRDRAGTHA